MRIRFAFVVGMFVLVVSGCFHGGYPYGNFGPGPSVLPAQPWTGNPYGPTYQPGYPINQPGPIYQPGGINPTPLGVPSDPNNAPGSGNSDPPQTYSPGGAGNAPGFNAVPQPGDDGGDLKRSGANILTPTSSAKSRTSVGDDLTSPFDQDSTRRAPRMVVEESVVDADDFVSPIAQTSGTDDGEIQQTGGSKVRGFAHHPRFEWVQGTVDYDEQARSWLIMYDDNPKTSDPFGGELTLANDPVLSRQLRAGDVVRISGAVDDSAADSRGKPLYRATQLQK